MAEQSRRPQAAVGILKLAALAVVTTMVAGCQVVPRAPRPAPPPVEAPPPQPELPPIAPPALPPEETRNRVAVLVPTTGPNAALGTSIANAANLALLDTGGDTIRLTIYDTARPGGAAAAANEAIAEGNGLFLGPLLADDVRAVAPVARARGVPVISFSNDVGVAGQGVYTMGLNPGQSVDRVVAFARSRGVQRFAALVPEGIYGQRAGQAMIEAVGRAGGRMVGMQSFDRGGLRAAVERLGAQGEYDAVLIADGGRVAVAAAPLVRGGASSGARILGTELWTLDPDLGDEPALRGAWYAAASDTMFNQLRTRYRARYGSNPSRLSSMGYDAVLLAVRIGQDWRLGRAFPRNALHDRTGFVGVDGTFRFHPDGSVERALEVKEVTAGGATTVSPAPRSLD